MSKSMCVVQLWVETIKKIVVTHWLMQTLIDYLRAKIIIGCSPSSHWFSLVPTWNCGLLVVLIGS